MSSPKTPMVVSSSAEKCWNSHVSALLCIAGLTGVAKLKSTDYCVGPNEKVMHGLFTPHLHALPFFCTALNPGHKCIRDQNRFISKQCPTISRIK